MHFIRAYLHYVVPSAAPCCLSVRLHLWTPGQRPHGAAVQKSARSPPVPAQTSRCNQFQLTMSRFSFCTEHCRHFITAPPKTKIMRLAAYTALDQTWRAAGALISQTGSARDVVLDGPGFIHVAAAIHYGEEATLSST